MFRILRRAASVVLAIAAGAAFGQTPAPPLAFERASIKPSPPINPAKTQVRQAIHAGIRIEGAIVDIGNFSVAALIAQAYDVKPYQILGPDWLTALTAPRFDVLAKIPEGATKEQAPEMLRTLLAERFKLRIHRETKDLMFYALVVGPGGPKLKKAEPLPTDGRPAPPSSSGSQLTVSASAKGTVVSDGEGGQQKMSVSADGKSMRIENTRISMAKFAELVSPMLDRPVVDMTGLTGDYQVALNIPMEDFLVPASKPGAGGASPARAGAAAGSSDGSIFASVEQLGLKLEVRKAPAEAVVIDGVEKTPTEK